MATVVFFEKPGCINNTKQKALLGHAGHTVDARNLLTHPWTADELLGFFGEMDVPKWFNPNAPDVYNGIVKPDAYTREEALSALLENPLLIKRPLMIIGDEMLVGFDKAQLDKMIGLSDTPNPEVAVLLEENLSDCPQKAVNTTCDDIAAK